MFHWEIIWSFLQGSLGLTQKQHCIRCRFYKVYLINYKTTTFSFFSFSFFFGRGGMLLFLFLLLSFWCFLLKHEMHAISIIHTKYQYICQCVYKCRIFMKIFDSALAMGNRYFTLNFFPVILKTNRSWLSCICQLQYRIDDNKYSICPIVYWLYQLCVLDTDILLINY